MRRREDFPSTQKLLPEVFGLGTASQIFAGAKNLCSGVQILLPTFTKKQNEPSQGRLFSVFAETGGFEPPIPFRVCHISSMVPSAAQPRLLLRLERILGIIDI